MPMIPSTSAIAPAIPSITSVKEVRATDLSYTSSIVRTDASGKFEFTDHTAARTSSRKLCVPALASYHERHRPYRVRGLASEQVLHHRWPINDFRRLVLHASFSNILYHADHLMPWHRGKLPQLFASRRRRRAPYLSRQILRNHHYWSQSVYVTPSKFPARNQSRSRRL